MTFKIFLNSLVSNRVSQSSFIVLAGSRNHPRSEKRDWGWGGGKESSTVPGIMGFFSLHCLSILHHSAVLCCTEIKV